MKQCPWCGNPWTPACTRTCGPFLRYAHLPQGEAYRRIREAATAVQDDYYTANGDLVLADRGEIEADSPESLSYADDEPTREVVPGKASVCGHVVWGYEAEFCNECAYRHVVGEPCPKEWAEKCLEVATVLWWLARAGAPVARAATVKENAAVSGAQLDSLTFCGQTLRIGDRVRWHAEIGTVVSVSATCLFVEWPTGMRSHFFYWELGELRKELA